MVRSAAKLVSNTVSNPIILIAVKILPMEFLPGSRPNSSPIATRTAGATCATTRLPGEYMAFHTSLMSFLMVIAPVGHTAAHCPQLTHSVCAISLPKAGLTTISAPLPAKSMAPTCCTSLHMRTQSPQRMHLSGSRTIDNDEASTGRCFLVFLNLMSLSPNLLARSWSLQLRFFSHVVQSLQCDASRSSSIILR